MTRSANLAGSPADFLTMPFDGFLGAVADGTAAPGGGCGAAAAVAIAAGLCAMTARLSARQLTADEAAELAGGASALQAGAAALIQADASSYQAVLAARRPADGAADASQADQVAAALSGAADIPLQVLGFAAQVACLADRLAADGNPNLRGDALTGLFLAEAGARAAAMLVDINLAGAPDDDRHATARRLLHDVASSARAWRDYPAPQPP
ncbi:MAG TPA: cyclodeaminase/cyclohydrolase family protein [Streptosporangiaceae bacterium]|nr:cyclodeaminase/cyclohydrolase family protein [Streptosporangiaceae bacterium]